MNFDILTLFPEIPRAFFESSIMAKAVKKDLIHYSLVNIRDFTLDKHNSCDDSPYGGGAGMLMLPEPLGRALDSVNAADKRVIYMSPSGKPFTQTVAQELSRESDLVIICGRYEGVDQRIIDLYVDDELSIGDYILSSGETAALVVIDAVYRLIEGVISYSSLEEETFVGGLLEYPQYTRPEVYKGLAAPEVLLSGHHERIKQWRLRKRIEKTLLVRPDLIERGLGSRSFSAEAVQIIHEMTDSAENSRLKGD